MFRWLATFMLIWFIYQVRHVFPPIIVGGIISYLLLPVVQTLSLKLNIKRVYATILVYAVLFGAMAMTVWLIGPAIVKEAKELTTPESQRELVHNAVEQITSVFKWQTDTDQLTEQILSGIMENVSNPRELQKGVGEFSHLMLSLLVCVVSSIYFTLDSESVGRFFLRYMPANRQTSIIELFGRMNKMLSKYVQGQILLILIMSGVAWSFLHFYMHMKYALPVAVLSGFLEIIPVLGPIIATTTATLVGIAQFGPTAALQIILFYTSARWLEDYVVVPKVIGHAVELHPLAVIFAVLCGETLAGALGMLIAIPVAACVKLVLDYFYTGQLPEERKADRRKRDIDSRERETEAQAAGLSKKADPGSKHIADSEAEAPPSLENSASAAEAVSRSDKDGDND